MPRIALRTGLVAGLLATFAFASPGFAITSITLRWTAPGDDGLFGTVASYEVRWSLLPITALSYGQATPVLGLPVPGPSGTKEVFTVRGLPEATTIYFALRSRDEAGNWSPMSNVAVYTSQPLGMPSVPNVVTLSQARPNPTRSEARFRVGLPLGGDVCLAVCDLAGRTVRAPAQRSYAPGEWEIGWDLRDDEGRPVPPGVYLVRVDVPGSHEVRRVAVLR